MSKYKEFRKRLVSDLLETVQERLSNIDAQASKSVEQSAKKQLRKIVEAFGDELLEAGRGQVMRQQEEQQPAAKSGKGNEQAPVGRKPGRKPGRPAASQSASSSSGESSKEGGESTAAPRRGRPPGGGQKKAAGAASSTGGRRGRPPGSGAAAKSRSASSGTSTRGKSASSGVGQPEGGAKRGPGRPRKQTFVDPGDGPSQGAQESSAE